MASARVDAVGSFLPVTGTHREQGELGFGDRRARVIDDLRASARLDESGASGLTIADEQVRLAELHQRGAAPPAPHRLVGDGEGGVGQHRLGPARAHDRPQHGAG